MVPRAAAGAAVLIALTGGAAGPLAGQRPERDTAPDTVRAGGAVDTAAARRLGLPTAPTRQFPAPDSVIERLLQRSGFEITRFLADSITLFARTREVVLGGEVLLERGTATLEADSVRYLDESCLMHATGRPALFDEGTVLVGEGMRYDACANRGTVREALTDFDQGGVTWYMRGHMALDSNSARIFAAGSRVTSCDLPSTHYHFHAGKMKWITKTIFVARPAVLYVRDVPIMWLPFIFQDIRSGRRSGLIMPSFGISDLVRPSRSYKRHVTGLGYYWAMSDYTDLQVNFDWFDDRHVTLTGTFNYRWLNRFLQGGLRVSRQEQTTGSSSSNIQWNHNQTFSRRSSLSASVNYSSNTRVVARNAVDPTNLTATIDSRINYNRSFDWGRVNIGGSRTQSITGPEVSQALPTVSLAPIAIDLGSSITWSPSFSLTNTQQFRQRGGTLQVPAGDSVITTELLAYNRRTNVSFNTPIRIGSWNWNNSFQITDSRDSRRLVQSALSPDSADRVVMVFGGDFATAVDWTTGIGLPSLFRNSWRLQPSISILNATGRGPFLLRNRNTGGRWVQQGKRLAFGASLSPTFFGFFPGVGPITRIRHSISPSISWQYAPAADLPEDYARALDPSGLTVGRRSDQQQQITFSLSQTFEGKLALPPGDTTADPRNAPKRKLLQINTSGVTYDFEQAKKPDRTGWTSQSLTNTLTSDLLRGFTVSLAHDLWDGPVGLESSKFDPFLTSISTRASLSGATAGALLSMLGIGAPRPPEPAAGDTVSADTLAPRDTAFFGPHDPLGPSSSTLSRMAPSGRGQRGFNLSLSFDVSRRRPDTTGFSQPDRRNLGISLSFSPTSKWSASWTTAYDLETKEFDQHVLRLDRDLHRWRATFSFLKLANGNFVFNFSVQLMDQPEIEFDYDQQTFTP